MRTYEKFLRRSSKFVLAAVIAFSAVYAVWLLSPVSLDWKVRAERRLEKFREKERTRICFERGGRMLEIDDVKGCIRLTIVPDSLVKDEFFGASAQQKCARIANAQWIKVDGYYNCWYFEPIEIGAGL